MSTPMTKTPPKLPSRSAAETRKILADDKSTNSTNKNVTKRTNKRRCLSGNDNEDGGSLSGDVNNDSNYLAEFRNEIAEMRDMIHNMSCLQNTRMDKLESYFIEIKTTNSKIEETFNDIEKSVNFVSDQLTSLDTKINGLEKERNSMVSKLTALEEKVESFDRSLVKTCIELRNVPKRTKESKNMLYDALLELAKQLDLRLEASDIRDVSRQPSKKESPNSTLTVEFTNTITKTNFLAAVRDLNKQNPNNKLNSSHLGIAAPKAPIYAAEQLTSNSKRLFYLARNYAKMNQYMFCWTVDGRIMMKKNPDSPSIVIKTELQLQRMSTPTDTNNT